MLLPKSLRLARHFVEHNTSNMPVTHTERERQDLEQTRRTQLPLLSHTHSILSVQCAVFPMRICAAASNDPTNESSATIGWKTRLCSVQRAFLNLYIDDFRFSSMPLIHGSHRRLRRQERVVRLGWDNTLDLSINTTQTKQRNHKERERERERERKTK